jgi:16S rRNA (guanine527-N7)-methyltransferase
MAQSPGTPGQPARAGVSAVHLPREPGRGAAAPGFAVAGRGGEVTRRAPAGLAGAIPDPPPAAREMFGPVLPAAERYARLLAGPGVERGLIGPREVPRLWERHLLNCAAIAGLVPRPATLADLGSGAGLPGIVLAMLLPEVTVTLLERMGRRAGFLRECVSELGLGNARVIQAQAAEVAGRISADVVTARAVAPLVTLAPMALALLRPGGQLLAIKGAGAEAEVSEARAVLQRLRVREVAVVSAGDGKVDPAATVVRLVAGP